jgi:hypothetical protein
MSELRELIEANAALIESDQFGVLAQRWFFQHLKLIDYDVWYTLTTNIDLELIDTNTAEIYLETGGGSYKMDSAYDFCICKVATEYIEEQKQEFTDDDEAEIIDYAEENPKTIDEVMM